MRLSRLTVLASSTLAALVLLPAAAAVAASHPSPNGTHSLTISVSENPIVEGQPIVIYGRLNGPNDGSRQVVLYHRSPYSSYFTPVQTTTTDAAGYYAFQRLPEKVVTDREWFARSLGARSATVHEHVYAQLTLTPSVPTGSTVQTGPRNPVSFSGSVTPASTGQVIELQRQDASGGESWHTIQLGRVRPGGQYLFVHEFRFPGDADIRVLLPRDGLNIASPSSLLAYQIEQAENPALTIEPSQNPITTGQAETVSGTLASGAGASLTLYARTAGGTFAPVANTTSTSGGAYSFPAQTLQNSTYYQVRSGSTDSTLLFIGVKYVVTASSESTTFAQGQAVTLTGSVTPAVSGHTVYLQEQAASGQWVTIARSLTASNSTFTLTRPLFVSGTVSLRAFVPGGPNNQGAASPTVSFTVTPVEASQLPQNSGSDEPGHRVWPADTRQGVSPDASAGRGTPSCQPPRGAEHAQAVIGTYPGSAATRSSHARTAGYPASSNSASSATWV